MDRKIFYILIAVYGLSLVLGVALFLKQPVKGKAHKQPAEFSKGLFR